MDANACLRASAGCPFAPRFQLAGNLLQRCNVRPCGPARQRRCWPRDGRGGRHRAVVECGRAARASRSFIGQMSNRPSKPFDRPRGGEGGAPVQHPHHVAPGLLRAPGASGVRSAAKRQSGQHTLQMRSVAAGAELGYGGRVTGAAGLPPTRPQCRAASHPALVRSAIRARSS